MIEELKTIEEMDNDMEFQIDFLACMIMMDNRDMTYEQARSASIKTIKADREEQRRQA